MSQSRGQSFLEALTNVGIGVLLAFGVQLAAFPVLGIQASMGQSARLAMIFTIISLVRSYLLRRVFNGLTRRRHS